MKRRSFRHLARDRDGASALEFALLAVPFLMLGLGTIEFGRLLWTREALQETAIAGARCIGVLQSSCAASGVYSATNAASYIEQVAAGWNVTLTSSNLTLTNTATCATVTGFSEVTITFSFQTVLPVLLPSFANGVPLTVEACFPNQSAS